MEEHRCHFHIGAGLHQQLASQEITLGAVDVLGAVGAVVHPARQVFMPSHQPQARDARRQRHVHHAIGAPARLAAAQLAETGFNAALELVQPRRPRDEADGAAHRTIAIQRALRPSQHLDAGHVDQGNVERALCVGHVQRDLVEIGADQRGAVAHALGKTAHLDAAGARRVLVDEQGRHHGLHLLDVGDATVGNLAATNGGDGVRHIDHQLRALGRRDFNLLKLLRLGEAIGGQ